MLQQLAGFAALFMTTALLSLGQGAVTSLTIQKGALFGFSDTFLGLVISVGYAGFFVGIYLMRYLLRRVSYIRAFAVCAAALGVFALAMPVFAVPGGWLVLRFLYGLFFSAATVTCEGWVNSKVGRGERSRVLGMYMTVNYLAYGMSQYALLIEQPSVAFSASAACLMLSLIPVCLTRFAEPQYASASAGGGKPLSLMDVYRIAPVAFVGQFGMGITTSAGWLFVRYVESLPLSEGGVALMAALFFSSGFVLQVPVGWLSDRARDRRDVISAAAGISAIVSFILFFGNYLPFYLLATLLLVFGSVSPTLFALNIAYGQDFAPREKAAEYSGGLFQSYSAGALIGPVAAGALMELFSPAWLFLMMAVVLIIMTASAATARLMPKIRPAKTEQHRIQTPMQLSGEGEVYSVADIGPQLPDDAENAEEESGAENDGGENDDNDNKSESGEGR
ncbi:MAG: MFS transporter [Gammaproteobacteria bacterium]